MQIKRKWMQKFSCILLDVFQWEQISMIDNGGYGTMEAWNIAFKSQLNLYRILVLIDYFSSHWLIDWLFDWPVKLDYAWHDVVLEQGSDSVRIVRHYEH